LIGTTASAQQDNNKLLSPLPGVPALQLPAETAPKPNAPKISALKADAPKADAPKTAPPKTDAPRMLTPPVTPAPVLSTPGSGSCLGGASFAEPSSDHGGGGLYGDVDFLLWWFKKSGVPPLITAGNPIDTPTGALGLHGTKLVFGDRNFGNDPFGGIRFTIGYGLDEDGQWGVESTTFILEQRRSFFNAKSTGAAGTGTLAVPFFNNDGRFEDADVVALAGTESGAISVSLVQRLWGTETNLRLKGPCGDNFRTSALVGFRYVDLEESLNLDTFSAALPTSTHITTALAESFATRNRFYGGQVGAEAEYSSGSFCLSVLAKVALGGNDEELNIHGTTVNVDPIFGRRVSPGGLFSGPLNRGGHGQGHFAVVPEIGVNLGYKINEKLCATIGYTFLYISEVARPGDQIDRAVNFQTDNRPRVLFHQSDFWAQGINIGLQYRY